MTPSVIFADALAAADFRRRILPLFSEPAGLSRCFLLTIDAMIEADAPAEPFRALGHAMRQAEGFLRTLHVWPHAVLFGVLATELLAEADRRERIVR